MEENPPIRQSGGSSHVEVLGKGSAKGCFCEVSVEFTPAAGRIAKGNEDRRFLGHQHVKADRRESCGSGSE
jgi:hypothetical protein